MNNGDRRLPILHLATPTHQRAYELVRELAHKDVRVLALAITGSAARNVGSFDSDLDFNVFFVPDVALGAPADAILSQWDVIIQREIRDRAGADVGIFFDVDLHAAPASFTPQPRGWTEGPDAFELEIGNTFVYTRLIFEREEYFSRAQARYLPYYDDALRDERLRKTLRFCHNNINHIAPYVQRGLYFQAFRRLYDASREFLQALMIARRVYPIAYDKWVKEQLVDLLGLPDLYARFVALYETQRLESDELTRKGDQLRACIVEYVEDAQGGG